MIWTSADLTWLRPRNTMEIQTASFKKMHLKLSFANVGHFVSVSIFQSQFRVNFTELVNFLIRISRRSTHALTTRQKNHMTLYNLMIVVNDDPVENIVKLIYPVFHTAGDVMDSACWVQHIKRPRHVSNRSYVWYPSRVPETLRLEIGHKQCTEYVGRRLSNVSWI